MTVIGSARGAGASSRRRRRPRHAVSGTPVADPAEATSLAEGCRAVLIESHDQLARCVESNGENTRACTAALTAKIEEMAISRGASVRREHAIDCFRASVRRGKAVMKQAHLDLHATFSDGSMLAVEIDTNFKAWSARKLRHAKAAGMIELWIRWSGEYTWASDIEVLNVSSAQRVWCAVRT